MSLYAGNGPNRYPVHRWLTALWFALISVSGVCFGADNPGVAVIELNNENTAIHNWYLYADLPDAFRAPLQKRWNQWLTGKYATTAALAKTWGEGYSAGAEVVRNCDFSAGTNEWQYGIGEG